MRRLTIIIVALALAVLAVGALSLGRDVINKARAKETVIHMRQVESLLLLDKPKFADGAYVSRLLAARGQDDYILDGWKHPIQVEVETDSRGQPRYRVISLGRDGRRGPCCQRFTGFDWDADAILVDQDWLQVWG
jgi:hypothetical protein